MNWYKFKYLKIILQSGLLYIHQTSLGAQVLVTAHYYLRQREYLSSHGAWR